MNHNRMKELSTNFAPKFEGTLFLGNKKYILCLAYWFFGVPDEHSS